MADKHSTGYAVDDPSSQILEECMQFIGFKLESFSPECVSGRFVVSNKSCQPFGVLHGGVSALIAESLASMAACIASGFQRVAGVELTINHIKAASIGTEVFVSAKPLHRGKKMHVWDVTFSKVEDSTQTSSDRDPNSSIIAVSRVTLMAGLTGESPKLYENLKLHSRL